jgi:phosphoglycerol transferase MdoB-like AlkP superfamily enzyme
MKNLRFLKPIISYFGVGLTITTLSRILLFLIFKERVVENENFSQLFSIGLRFDIILLSYTAFVPTLLILVLPNTILQKIKKFINLYFIFFLFLFFLMELATHDFIKQYDTRPNRLFLDYLIYPKEVIGTLLKSYLPSLLISAILLNSAMFFALKFGKKLF